MSSLSNDSQLIVEFMIVLGKFCIFGVALAMAYAWVKYGDRR